MRRKFITILVEALVVVMLSSTATFAASKDAEIMVYLDGYSLSFEVPPIIENGTTLVPIRNILEPLDYGFGYNPETKLVVIFKESNDGIGMHFIDITLGSNKVREYDESGYIGDDLKTYSNIYNERTLTLSTPAKIIDGRTMVPLRFIAEISGYNVTWDPEYRIVHINNPGYVPDTISDEQKAINDKYVQQFNTPVDSAPGAFQ